MSLASVVKEIAQEMQQEAEGIRKKFTGGGETLLAFALDSYAKQLLRSLEAVADSPSFLTSKESEWQRQAREEFSKKKSRQEEDDTEMVRILDGPLKDDHVTIASSMPLGARCFVSGLVHEKTREGLIFRPTEQNVKPLTEDS